MEPAREQEIVEMHSSGIGIGAIAAEMGVSTTTIRNVLKKYGQSTKQARSVATEDIIAEDYVNGDPVPDILVRHGINHSKLYAILARHGIETRRAAAVNGNKLRLDQAVQMYEDGASIYSITEETGIAQPTLHAELHKRAVKLRRPRGRISQGAGSPIHNEEDA